MIKMFCPECGNTEEPLIDGICKTCFLKTYKMLKIPENIDIEICKHCNSKLLKGQWIDEYIPEEEVIYRTLEDEIEIDKLAENPIIDLEIKQMRGTIAECEINSSCEISNTIIEDTYETNVKINHTVCPTCSKRESGYYEAVIQVRGDKRTPENEEIKEIEELIQKTIEKQYHKDKLAYIPQILKPKEGRDYYIGSLKTARKIINTLKSNIGGNSKESPRLISEDSSTGKGLYRIWISYRLSQFQNNDFVEFENKIYQIKNVNGKHITSINLKTYETKNIGWNKYEKISLLKKYNEEMKTTVTDKNPNYIQILDPETYNTEDIELKKEYENINIGDEINCIKINKQIYIII